MHRAMNRKQKEDYWGGSGAGGGLPLCLVVVRDGPPAYFVVRAHKAKSDVSFVQSIALHSRPVPRRLRGASAAPPDALGVPASRLGARQRLTAAVRGARAAPQRRSQSPVAQRHDGGLMRSPREPARNVPYMQPFMLHAPPPRDTDATRPRLAHHPASSSFPV